MAGLLMIDEAKGQRMQEEQGTIPPACLVVDNCLAPMLTPVWHLSQSLRLSGHYWQAFLWSHCVGLQNTANHQLQGLCMLAREVRPKLKQKQRKWGHSQRGREFVHINFYSPSFSFSFFLLLLIETEFQCVIVSD